ncbi:MAG: putative toxin [Hyphomicrobium sp.]
MVDGGVDSAVQKTTIPLGSSGSTIPDIATATALTEIKNVAVIRARDAPQIALQADIAAVRGLEMNLLVRPGADLTRISGLMASGEISVSTIPGIAANGFRALTAESAATGSLIWTTINGASSANASPSMK